MPQATDLLDIYDPETQFERAIAAIAQLPDFGFVNVITRENAKEFEIPTERIEIRFTNGEATRHTAICPDGFKRNDAWRGQLAIQIITISKPLDDANAHGKQRARVRAMAGMLAQLINTDAYLPFHSVNDVLDTGTTPSVKSKEGYEASTLIYAVHFNVRPDAWPTTPTP